MSSMNNGLPTAATTPPSVLPTPAIVPLTMLFGREHIKADKFGALILSSASNLFPDPAFSYESGPLLSDAIALIKSITSKG
jgi:hypothetical protein